MQLTLCRWQVPERWKADCLEWAVAEECRLQKVSSDDKDESDLDEWTDKLEKLAGNAPCDDQDITPILADDIVVDLAAPPNPGPSYTKPDTMTDMALI
ncbi:hypothetical protein NDU88_001192 [Pleurodeles waltl]|uniref:Uncharacterized protein n=1 Tax=Pleurodeles waltl TaxID=8319 RepID=A0AAV7LGT6_PLEWA|nr:hypothetical protein NDU88_001192 [Pleurodeles waltl]